MLKRKGIPIGVRAFDDGIIRAVFVDVDGRQFVVDGKEKIYCTWIVTEEDVDKPAIVKADDAT